MRPLRTFKQFCRENMDAPTDQHGHILSTFELSVAQLIDELADLRDYAIVEVTLDENDPTKVMLKFKREGE